MRNHALHIFIKERIERELNGRTWHWLAKASGIPQSTLANQVARPKFSLDVLDRIAATLDRELAYFLPGRRESSRLLEVDEVISRIQAVLDEYGIDQGE